MSRHERPETGGEGREATLEKGQELTHHPKRLTDACYGDLNQEGSSQRCGPQQGITAVRTSERCKKRTSTKHQPAQRVQGRVKRITVCPGCRPHEQEECNLERHEHGSEPKPLHEEDPALQEGNIGSQCPVRAHGARRTYPPKVPVSGDSAERQLGGAHGRAVTVTCAGIDHPSVSGPRRPTISRKSPKTAKFPPTITAIARFASTSVLFKRSGNHDRRCDSLTSSAHRCRNRIISSPSRRRASPARRTITHSS